MVDKPRKQTSYTLRPGQRLSRGEEIKKVLRKGRRISSPACCLYFIPGNAGLRRFAVITTKRIGNSVARNRAKRLLREAARLNKDDLIDGIDVILKPRSKGWKTQKPGGRLTYRDVEPLFLSLCKRAGILKTK